MNSSKSFYFDLQKAIEIAKEITLPKGEKVLLKYIEQYYDGGELKPINIPESAAGAAMILSSINRSQEIDAYESFNGEEKENKVLIAKGTFSKDVEWEDSDPFPTAGGYIEGIAKAGSDVSVYLSYDYRGFKIELVTDVHILEKHYNNNFFGNSTGGGTTTYEEGENVRRKVVHTQMNEIVGITGWMNGVKMDYDLIEDFIHSQGKTRDHGKVA